MSALLQTVRFKDASNWSVAHLMESQFNYNKKYELVRIGNFLTRNKNRINIEDDVEYKRVTIRINNKGIRLRDRVMGRDIGTKKQFLIKEGQFLLSKIDARNGAFGLATDEVDGAIITADFFAYEIDKSKIEPYFLVLLTTTKQFQKFAQGASRGTTGRQRIDEKSFLDVKIPLPSLEKQKEIVEAYQAKINLAQKQELEAKEKEKEIEEYFISKLGLSKEKKSKDMALLKFTNFQTLKRWTVKDLVNSDEYTSNLFKTVLFSSIIEEKPKYGSNSKGIKKISDTRYIRITDINEDGSLNNEVVSAEKVEEQYILKENDFLIARSGNTVGKTFLYNEKHGRCLYAGYLIKFILNKKIINPLFLLFYTKSFLYKQWIKSNLRVAGQPNINSQEYLSSPIILPPLEAQNKIVIHIQTLKDEIKELKEKAEQNRVLALSEFEEGIFSEA